MDSDALQIHSQTDSERNYRLDMTDASYPNRRDDCPTRNKNLELPPEILHNIIADVVSGYVDLFITEPRDASNITRRLEPQHQDDNETVQSADSDVDPDGTVVHDLQEATEKLPHNIIISLLSVSYLFRDITLKILSDGFGIERTTDRKCVMSLNTKLYCQGLMCHPKVQPKVS
jgi:hypothetical protein